MGLRRLSKKCQKCPFVDKCDNKRMEALGYLPEPYAAEVLVSATEPAAAPVLRETQTIYIEGKPMQVYKDDIAKMFEDRIYSQLGLPGYNLGGRK